MYILWLKVEILGGGGLCWGGNIFFLHAADNIFQPPPVNIKRPLPVIFIINFYKQDFFWKINIYICNQICLEQYNLYGKTLGTS